ncbi:hypothetical protein FZI91_16175 [Mycobacterium sp. CBMA271]|uniref:hypothetical protein n=1 Tax=unclassified Mycobacteroides TaxID=2618759 RepID=UPI0012DE99F2|nr:MULTISPECIES: hypothetical protein [unclassified Mycobacteroides]MUM23228.1 hypothetical protein [Mycobacteroides sp. CBMA 271]
MKKLLAAIIGGAGAAATVALLGAPVALAASPAPPPVCYAQETSVNEIDHRPCVTPGGSAYEQGVHQPTHEGANPLIPLGTNPHVPFGTNQANTPSPNA